MVDGVVGLVDDFTEGSRWSFEDEGLLLLESGLRDDFFSGNAVGRDLIFTFSDRIFSTCLTSESVGTWKLEMVLLYENSSSINSLTYSTSSERTSFSNENASLIDSNTCSMEAKFRCDSNSFISNPPENVDDVLVSLEDDEYLDDGLGVSGLDIGLLFPFRT